MNQRVRSFFAVALPEEARQAAARLAGRLRESDRGEGVRWVRPEGVHLTLKFLGDVPAEQVPEIAQAVQQACEKHAPFACAVSELGCFPKYVLLCIATSI